MSPFDLVIRLFLQLTVILAACRLVGMVGRRLGQTRGLMELIILNIGLQQGVITHTLFTIMVLMAVVTTLMASPLFHFFVGRGPTAEDEPARSLASAPGRRAAR